MIVKANLVGLAVITLIAIATSPTCRAEVPTKDVARALYLKGRSGNRAGRLRGTPNMLTGEVRTLVADALEQAGDVDYLVRQAEGARYTVSTGT